jgi:hypothetical protein
MERILAACGNGRAPQATPANGGGASLEDVRAAAMRAAVAVHGRARFQHNQVTRLRRRSFEVVPVPFMWRQQLDVEAVRRISERLEQGLAG